MRFCPVTGSRPLREWPYCREYLRCCFSYRSPLYTLLARVGVDARRQRDAVETNITNSVTVVETVHEKESTNRFSGFLVVVFLSQTLRGRPRRVARSGCFIRSGRSYGRQFCACGHAFRSLGPSPLSLTDTAKQAPRCRLPVIKTRYKPFSIPALWAAPR